MSLRPGILDQSPITAADAVAAASHVRDADGCWNAPVFVAPDGVLEFTPLAMAMVMDKI